MLVPLDARQCVLHRVAKRGCGAEIGVHQGNYSLNLLNTTKPKKFYLVDPWIGSGERRHAKSRYSSGSTSQAEMDTRYALVMTRFAKQIMSSAVEILRRSSADASRLIDDKSLDFAYIDGDHNYEGVKADLARYWPKVKARGLLISDVYTTTGWWKDGVVRAIHEFLPTVNCQVDFVIGTQFCIRKLG